MWLCTLWRLWRCLLARDRSADACRAQFLNGGVRDGGKKDSCLGAPASPVPLTIGRTFITFYDFDVGLSQVGMLLWSSNKATPSVHGHA